MRVAILTTLSVVPFLAFAQQLPQPSPSGHVEQVVGLTTIKVDYSRPSMRDRKIFGDLVPYGKVWRTGANKCTTFQADGPVKVEGVELPAGIYSLFTIPGEEVWTIIFNKDTSLWGEGDRKEEADVLRVKVVVGKSYEPIETFTFSFANVKDDKADLVMSWESRVIRIGLFADATKQGLANIRAALAEPSPGAGAYNRSARFCVDRGMMLVEALQWATKSVSMEKKYWSLYTLALAQAANGNTKEAIATAEEGMKVAQEEKSEAYVKLFRERILEWRRAPAGTAK
ncbi:MAG: DUF2911 domain-containing protein [Flavobacteriales bacterium]|nr:DUF2911 domain-containing protein [Flavobacteriales bacterium]